MKLNDILLRINCHHYK